MKNFNIIMLVLVLVTLAGYAFSAEMGSSGGFDLDALWASAQAEFDLAAEDAVLLLDHRDVSRDADGTLRTRVHEVVWISTSVGIRAYADLRIPWNQATTDLEVEVLRTWREDAWWPGPDLVSPTAVVPTLPYAVDHADDYTTMRETMLLHDGVELPCIMETVYVLTERGVPATDGLFLMAGSDPTVLARLTLRVPADGTLQFESRNGAPDPEMDTAAGIRTYTWTMENVPALGLPATPAPAIHEPAVVWSTWTDWAELRDHWRGIFDAAAVLDEALTDSLAVWTEPALSRWSRLEALAEAVESGVRSVHYPDRFWRYAPRPATRTWSTAYGHALDRAVLAAALFRGAGYEVTPIFVGPGNAFVGEGVPRLEDLGRLYLSIKGDPAGLYDPETGILDGQAPLIGKPVWRTDLYVDPFLGNSQWPNRLEVSVILEPGENGTWTGTGRFEGAGVFCPQGEMAGLAGGAAEYLGGLIGSVIPGAVLNEANPEIFHQHQVVFGLDLAVEMPEPDSSGKTRLVVGAPPEGLAGQLPGVHLYEDTRSSPVLLPGDLMQHVTVRLKVEGTPAHLPGDLVLENEAGTFTVTATARDGWVTLDREITVTGQAQAAARWPQLRALLLEDGDPANGTVLLD